MLRISSADLMGTAAIQAGKAQDALTRGREYDGHVMPHMHDAIENLIHALSESALAYDGIKARMPQWDADDIDRTTERIESDIRKALRPYYTTEG